MMFLQFASKKDHAQTFAQITPSEEVIWGPKWVWFWHDPRAWSTWR